MDACFDTLSAARNSADSLLRETFAFDAMPIMLVNSSFSTVLSIFFRNANARLARLAIATAYFAFLVAFATPRNAYSRSNIFPTI